MKKIIMILAVCLLMLGLTSCSKEDRTCSCTATNSVSKTSVTQYTTYKHVTNQNAKRACVSTSKKEADGSTTTVECHVVIFDI